MPGLREEASTIIDESVKMLDIEEAEDNQLRDKHGSSKWSRTQSKDLNSATRNEGAKLTAVLQNAGASDGTLTSQFDANRDGIATLSQSADQLEQVLPSSSNRTASHSAGLGELRSLLNQLDSLRLERDQLEREIETEKVSHRPPSINLSNGLASTSPAGRSAGPHRLGRGSSSESTRKYTRWILQVESRNGG